MLEALSQIDEPTVALQASLTAAPGLSSLRTPWGRRGGRGRGEGNCPVAMSTSNLLSQLMQDVLAVGWALAQPADPPSALQKQLCKVPSKSQQLLTT